MQFPGPVLMKLYFRTSHYTPKRIVVQESVEYGLTHKNAHERLIEIAHHEGYWEVNEKFWKAIIAYNEALKEEDVLKVYEKKLCNEKI